VIANKYTIDFIRRKTGKCRRNFCKSLLEAAGNRVIEKNEQELRRYCWFCGGTQSTIQGYLYKRFEQRESRKNSTRVY